MRKKIRLYAYWNKNLGDDLMVHILLKRYPDLLFYSNEWNRTSARFAEYPNYDNWDSLGVKYGRINHILNILTLLKKKDFFMEAVRRSHAKCCASVYIGGSIYMEMNRPIADRLLLEEKKTECKPLYVIGANFGPYRTEEFRDGFSEFFRTIGGVTFRDRASYELFQDNPRVAYAPDVVFNLDVADLDCPVQDNKVLISVIDMARRADLAQYTNVYDDFIAQLCVTCAEQGKPPLLMSFCKGEGDEAAIERILSKLPDSIRKETDTYYYRGDITEALTVIGSAERVIATRFHAMILALKFGKPFFSISYNAKVKNVLSDIGCDGYCEISTLKDWTAGDVLDKCAVWDVTEYAKQAEQQFSQLDDFLKGT